jgi:DNA-binding transcriptional LysR family regulator
VSITQFRAFHLVAEPGGFPQAAGQSTATKQWQNATVAA